MPCPTCSHTLHVLGVIDGRRHLHCPRCGHHRIECGEGVTHDTVPLLVQRCRDFETQVLPDGRRTRGALAALWMRLGIDDAITQPGDRQS